MFDRKSLIVYFRNPKVLKQLNQYGNLAYYHKKRKYAVLYVNSQNESDVIQKLYKLRHVRKIEVSLLYDSYEMNQQAQDV